MQGESGSLGESNKGAELRQVRAEPHGIGQVYGMVPHEGQAVEDSLTRARLSVVETVYHQQYGEQPTCVDSRWSRWLGSADQPYQRKLKAGPSWTPLVTSSWLEKVGQLVLANDEGRFDTVVPSYGERLEAARRVLEVCYSRTDPSLKEGPESFCTTSPQETVRFVPTNVDHLWVRCQRGTARYTVTLFPA